MIVYQSSYVNHVLHFLREDCYGIVLWIDVWLDIRWLSISNAHPVNPQFVLDYKVFAKVQGVSNNQLDQLNSPLNLQTGMPLRNRMYYSVGQLQHNARGRSSLTGQRLIYCEGPIGITPLGAISLSVAWPIVLEMRSNYGGSPRWMNFVSTMNTANLDLVGQGVAHCWCEPMEDMFDE